MRMVVVDAEGRDDALGQAAAAEDDQVDGVKLAKLAEGLGRGVGLEAGVVGQPDDQRLLWSSSAAACSRESSEGTYVDDDGCDRASLALELLSLDLEPVHRAPADVLEHAQVAVGARLVNVGLGRRRRAGVVGPVLDRRRVRRRRRAGPRRRLGRRRRRERVAEDGARRREGREDRHEVNVVGRRERHLVEHAVHAAGRQSAAVRHGKVRASAEEQVPSDSLLKRERRVLGRAGARERDCRRDEPRGSAGGAQQQVRSGAQTALTPSRRGPACRRPPHPTGSGCRTSEPWGR